jgi:hypothetical protein
MPVTQLIPGGRSRWVLMASLVASLGFLLGGLAPRADAAGVTYKGEFASGLDMAVKFSVKNGTMKFTKLTTNYKGEEDQSTADCDGGETAQWAPGPIIASPPVKVVNHRFVFKSKVAGTNASTKFVGEVKGRKVEGTFAYKHFDGASGEKDCTGKVAYTATK